MNRTISKPSAIFLLLFLTCAAMRVSAQQEAPGVVTKESEKNFNLLKRGMTESEVRETVGFPFRAERFVTMVKGSKDTTTYWLYQNLYTVVFVSHRFSHVEKERNDFLYKVQTWTNPKNADNVRVIYVH